MSGHMNELAKTGWEYVRSDTLTTKRVTIFGKAEDTLNVLVFRRPFTPDNSDAPDTSGKQGDGSVLRVAFKREQHAP
jgi:hypothetical protein